MNQAELTVLCSTIKELWPTWETPARLKQLFRLAGQYQLKVVESIVQEMSDDPDLRYFDARVLRRRLLQREGNKLADAYEELDERGRLAWTVRRDYIAHAKRKPDLPWPDYANLNDDQILVLYEQNYRRDAMKVYGYVPSHFDWSRVERVGLDDPKGVWARAHVTDNKPIGESGRNRLDDADLLVADSHMASIGREFQAARVDRP